MQVTIKTDNDSLLQMFAVDPKRDCPHITQDFITKTEQMLQTVKKQVFELPCKLCEDKKENWVCLVCNEIYCSRYVNAHMAEHCTKEHHVISLSLIDLSFWCYECDSYITNFDLDKLRLKFSNLKFNSMDDVENLADSLSLLNLENKDKAPEVIKKINETKAKEEIKRNENKEEVKKNENKEEIEESKAQEKFTYEKLIEGIKNKKFKKIAFLTGAGISVAAGIPGTIFFGCCQISLDFRTPGTGIYSQLQKYNLEKPEHIFDINFFLEHPEPFYFFAKEFLTQNAQPVTAHYFQALLEKRNQLLISLTQNIDGLELAAGLDKKFLVQAHGHLRTGHCTKCQKEIDMAIFKKHVEEGTIMKCECDGICKPDIVFFGESLPKDFFARIEELKNTDLAFIMGTGLAVAPFNYFAKVFLQNVPLVCINNFDFVLRTKLNQGLYFENELFLQGDIEEQIQKIVKDCELESELGNIQQEKSKLNK